MSMASEFREFAVKGNVMDMAVGIIIGAAFGKIVTSLVNDIIMPPIGVLIGGVDFSALAVLLKEAVVAADGAILKPAVTLNYGKFIQTVLDFTIVAWAIFLLVKVMNRMRRIAEKNEKAK
jgi:large conductance mechanosensitive channel